MRARFVLVLPLSLYALAAACTTPFSTAGGGGSTSSTTTTSTTSTSGGVSCSAGCPTGASCVDARCACATTTETACSDGCIDLQTSAANCGTCGHACAAGDTCGAGQCLCAKGGLDCGGGACLDGTTDVDNCGSCGFHCETGDACVNGACTCAGNLMCPVPVCTTKTGAGDPENCGTCGTSCMDSQVCTNGACVCRPLLTDCGGGACVDLESDPANCGACGKTCSTGEVCLSSAIGMPGACTPVLPTSPCPANYTDCKAEGCVLTAAMKGNPIHCGGCNNVCAPNEICTTGATPSCVKYFASPSCTACPCTACGGDHRCCEMGGAALCVEGAVCGF